MATRGCWCPGLANWKGEEDTLEMGPARHQQATNGSWDSKGVLAAPGVLCQGLSPFIMAPSYLVFGAFLKVSWWL